MSAATGVRAEGVAVLLASAAARLGGPDARLDAELLLSHATGRSRAWLFANPAALPGEADRSRFEALVSRRAAGEPLAYLTGRAGFWSFDLEVGPATLVPRPATERLVELALARTLPAAARVLDLGTGSGAIALALARERPGWQVCGVDIDAHAVAIARRNAARLGLPNACFRTGDWYEGLAGERFDLLVSNPPYIAATDPCLREDGLRFEPARALASGPEGLDALRAVIGAAPAHLRGAGVLACEHGNLQGEAVRGLLAAAGFVRIETWRDLEGHERASAGELPSGAAPGAADG